MPDFGKGFMGSRQDLAGFHRALLVCTWAGQNLYARWSDTLVTRGNSTWTARATTQRHTKGRLPCIERRQWWFKKTKLRALVFHTRVYIQLTRAFKLLPIVLWTLIQLILGMTHPSTMILGMSHCNVQVIHLLTDTRSPWLITRDTPLYCSHNQ